MHVETDLEVIGDNLKLVRLGDKSVNFDCRTYTPGATIAQAQSNIQTPGKQSSQHASLEWEDYLELAGGLMESIEIKSQLQQYDIDMYIVWSGTFVEGISLYVPRFDMPEMISAATLTDLTIDDTTSIATEAKKKSDDIEGFLAKLKNLYRVYIDQEIIISQYLRNHTDMLSVIEIAVINAKQLFDEKTELSLEMYYDIDSEERSLTLYVRQSKYEDEIMKKIDMVCNAYESVLSDKSDWFLVTTDFQHPKHQ